MANLVEWITEIIGDEIIESVVIGDKGWGGFESHTIPQYESQIRNKVLSWEQAKPMLDYEFDSGFGSPGCNAVTVWTPTRVLFVSQYDGATSLESVPRNPIDHEPPMPGG